MYLNPGSQERKKGGLIRNHWAMNYMKEMAEYSHADEATA